MPRDHCPRDRTVTGVRVWSDGRGLRQPVLLSASPAASGAN